MKIWGLCFSAILGIFYDEVITLPQHNGYQWPSYATLYPRRTNTWNAPQWKRKNLHNWNILKIWIWTIASKRDKQLFMYLTLLLNTRYSGKVTYLNCTKKELTHLYLAKTSCSILPKLESQGANNFNALGVAWTVLPLWKFRFRTMFDCLEFVEVVWHKSCL